MSFDCAARTLFIMLQFEIKVSDGQRHTQLQLLLKNYSNHRSNQQKITNEHEVCFNIVAPWCQEAEVVTTALFFNRFSLFHFMEMR